MTATATAHRPGRRLPSEWTEDQGVGCGHCGGWMTREVAGERWLCSGCPVGEGRRELPVVLDERLLRLELREGLDVTSQPPELEVKYSAESYLFREHMREPGVVRVKDGPRPWPWLDPMTDRNRAARQRERQAQATRERDVRALITRLTETARDGEHVLAEPCSEPGVQRRYLRRFDDGRPEQLVGDLLDGWVWRPAPGGPDLEPPVTVQWGGRRAGKTRASNPFTAPGGEWWEVRTGVYPDPDRIRSVYEQATQGAYEAAGGFRLMNDLIDQAFRAEYATQERNDTERRQRAAAAQTARREEHERAQPERYARLEPRAHRVWRDGQWLEVLLCATVDEHDVNTTTLDEHGWSWSSEHRDEWTRPVRG